MLSLPEFFGWCVGDWSIERTYHYFPEQRRELSHTNYHITTLDDKGRTKVLSDNQHPTPTGYSDGFYLAFDTTSETGEKVAMALHILFIPTQETGSVQEGLYLRDRAYEEDRPIISQFRYDSQSHELLMTTPYSRVVSVDSIMFVNPNLRLRRIVNYRRTEGPPSEPVLVGFGIEQRVS